MARRAGGHLRGSPQFEGKVAEAPESIDSCGRRTHAGAPPRVDARSRAAGAGAAKKKMLVGVSWLSTRADRAARRPCPDNGHARRELRDRLRSHEQLRSCRVEPGRTDDPVIATKFSPLHNRFTRDRIS